MSLTYRFFCFFYVSNFQSLVFLYMSYKELKQPKVGFGALYVILLQPCQKINLNLLQLFDESWSSGQGASLQCSGLCSAGFSFFFFFLIFFIALRGLGFQKHYFYSIAVRSAAPHITLWGGPPGPRFEPGTGNLEARALTTRPPNLLKLQTSRPP